MKQAYACLIIACLAARAHADSKTDEARQHLQNGAQLYDENNLRGALVEFERAYELAPSYKILFNIGQVEMELQDYAGALRAYTRYVKEGGPDISQDRLTQVNAEIERLKGRVGYLTVQTNAGAEVLVDDTRIGFAPLPEPVAVGAGQHKVTVSLKGRDPVSRVFDVAGRQEVTAALAIEGVPDAKGTNKEETAEPPSMTPVYVWWSVAGAFGIGAGTYALITRADNNKLDALRHTYPVTPAQLDDQATKTKRDAAITDVLTGATVVCAGVALYYTLTRTGAEKKPPVARLLVSPTGAAVVGRF